MLRLQVAAIGVIGLLLASAAHSEEQVRIVKTFGNEKHFLSQIAFNDRGDVAFVKSYQYDTELWYAPANQPADIIAATKSGLPEIEGEIKGFSIDLVAINDLGHVAFKATVRSGTSKTGVWRYDPEDGLSCVCKEGTLVPAHPGKYFGVVNLHGITGGPDCRVVFTSNPVDPREVKVQDPRRRFDLDFRNRVHFVWQRPVHGGISPYGDGSVRGVVFALNDGGDAVVLMNGVQNTIHLVSNGITIPVFTSGDVVSMEGSDHPVHFLYGASINRRKDVAFAASVSPHRTVVLLFERDSNKLLPMLIAGHPIEGYPHAKIDINTRVIVNDIGNVLAYSSSHNENEESVSSIFFCEKGKQPVALVKDGDEAPGTEAVFHGPTKEERARRRDLPRPHRGWASRLNASVPFSCLSFNRSNQAAFGGLLGGNVDETNDDGIWLANANDRSIELVIRKGDAFEENGKTIKSIRFEGASGGSTVNRGLNERGQLVYAVVFDDQSSAIVIDDRFASDPAREVAAPKVVHIDAARIALAEWTKRADAEIELLRKLAKESDFSKLTAVSTRLRAEYSEVQLELLKLRNSTQDLDAITRHARIQRLEHRLRELPEIWNALAHWPFQKIASQTPVDTRKIAAEASRLLDEYGNFDEIRRAVREKSKELSVAIPKTLEFVLRDFHDHAHHRTFPFASSSDRLTIFDKGIGTLRPGVFLDEKPEVGNVGYKVPDGPLVELREHIAALANFQIASDGRLVIDRDHWLGQRAKTSEAEVYAAAHDLLTEAKVSKDLIFDKRTREFGLRFSRMNNAGGNSTAVIDAFARFQEVAQKTITGNGGSSSGGTGGGNSASRRFRLGGAFGAQIDTDSDLIYFQFNEMTGAKRSFSVRCAGDAQVRLSIESDEGLFLFLQRSNGSVRWIRDVGETSVVRFADSFAELYKKHPAEIDREFIDFLNAHGVKGPVKTTDDAFLATVTNRLRRHTSESDIVNKLLVQLDSADFDERETAFKELAENALLYHSALEESAKTDLSFEVKSRVQELLNFSKMQMGEYDDLVEALGTLESAEQLKALREKSPPDHRAMYDAQLRLLEQ